MSNSKAKQTMVPDALQPHSVETENALLGAILVDPMVLLTIPELSRNDFYQAHCGLIFESIMDLHREGVSIDLVTLADHMEARGLLDGVGGLDLISHLINSCPTSLHAAEYANSVKKYSILRQVIQSAGQIAQTAYEKQTDELDAVLAKVEADLHAINLARRERGLRPIKKVMQGYYDALESSGNKSQTGGLSTGLTDVDNLMGRMHPGDLIIIGGRPGMGKTAFGLNVLLDAAKAGKTVAFFSLEMTAEQVCERLISHECGIPVKRLRAADIKDDEWPLFLNTSGTLSELNIWLDERQASTLEHIRTEAMAVKAQTGELSLIAVDYLQLMECPSQKDRQQQIAQISRGLKGLAKELHVPIIALSQLSRAVESRNDKRPGLSDLRESGNIEQDADIVLFLYRDEVYNEDTSKPNTCEVIAAKHRHGATGKAEVYFEGKTTSFKNLAKPSLTNDVEF